MSGKKIAAVLLSLVFICPALAVNSFADENINVLMNGEPIAFDVQPQNIGGRVMVPFRAVGEAIGARVDWNGDARSVWMYRNGQYIGLTIGDRNIRIGKMGGPEISVALDVAPQIVGGRTLVPVRAVSEGLKCGVKWDPPTNTVFITSDEPDMPAADSKEKLLAVIEGNIKEQKTKFSVDTTGLSSETIGLNICDYFLNVRQANTKWWSYTAAGNKYTYIEYNIVYSMYANVSKAIKTGDTLALAPDETQVYNKVNQIVAEYINPDMSDYEKEITLHDYLVRNTAPDTLPSDQVPWDSHTPYGALIKGVAVCNGYSDSFKLLMDAAGVECDIVYGEATNSDGITQKHAWNRVNIEGDYYLADVYWDDAFPDKPDVVAYDYFNVTDEMIGADHKPFTVEHECVSDKYNYFVYNNLLVYDQKDIDYIIQTSLENNVSNIFMRGVNFDVSRMSFQAFARYSQITTDIKYSVNRRMNVMRIIL